MKQRDNRRPTSIAWNLGIPVMDFVRRCNVFPANINKPGGDDIDAFTQMVSKMREYNFGLAKWIEKKAQEEAAGGQAEIQTCFVEIDGRQVLLQFDELRRLWFDPKNPDTTYPEGEGDS